ncbi:NAD-dependent epimerase/dehydratase [Alkaliphilus metalliredigens QYMF]|uniref:NAD-dependent epimerase/dehydratase n=1 Tax=Alkaliphilus metalliredigens (strain QYMF) TaxID=293826 RepID=A6TNW4_ALKMQ|nr:L-threonine 3-dehydrogenase [Alkaliphilus metalliredigens]ABR47882.1 NAD-dependent epimerase/dehydratase [Alkaliphilus metalliredigens QYMF]
MKKILVTGALGQIGTELVMKMRDMYGANNVIASSRSKRKETEVTESGPFELVDVVNAQQIADAVKKHNVDTVVNLAAILSASGEANPSGTWDINMGGLYNILEVARENNCAVCTPSSIAVFGPSTPKEQTPQDTVMRPTTMYGVTKVAGELLCDYYHMKFNVDTRGMRYPGLISNKALPGGGTTDYAVHIYYEALKHKKYECFLDKGTRMDMMYMPDALNAVIQLMEADPAKLIHRNAFNVTAMSFDPEGIAAEIRKHIPEFELTYNVNQDIQKIANSWPDSLDDSQARKQWNWNPKYDLASMTEDMLTELKKKLNI